MIDCEDYLSLFEDVIATQAERVGTERAREEAKQAGLGLDSAGRIVSCTGNPMVVLLRLMRVLTSDGNLLALEACAPLIAKLTEMSDILEPAETE